ncbi:MAG TPA: TIGR03435 family protein [Vicinamibacterales bacterium]|nr:TIGR03435 family protein [Vicinamibacterales bacterium]
MSDTSGALTCRCASAALTILLVAATTAAGQSTAPRFENISIKRNISSSEFSDASEHPKGITFINVTVRELLLYAFELQEFRLVDAPSWTSREQFDVIARSEGSLNDAQRRQRTRTLLIDRFALRARTERRERPIYELTVARSDRALGPGLRRRQDGCERNDRAPAPQACGRGIAPVDAGLIRMFGVTMDWLAAHPLSAAAGTLVVDRTQLDGWYDVDLRYRPDASHGDHRDLATEITEITEI